MYYAEDGRLLSIGAEARRPDVDQESEEGLVTSVEWCVWSVSLGWSLSEFLRFKLYLCPPSLRPEGLGLPTLPPNKTIVSIVADFFAYLFKCARDYIQETHANGVRLWNSLGDRIDVVVSHPSRWEGEPQTKLREAAILAGLITDTPVGRARLHFITEGEASMHHFVNGDITASLDTKVSCMLVTMPQCSTLLTSIMAGWVERDGCRCGRRHGQFDDVQIHHNRTNRRRGNCSPCM